MTKAEAIVMLKRIQEPEAWEPQINQAAFDALDMAIKALEQQPCGDTISRQDAIDAAALSAAEWDGMYVQDINGRIREALEKLPSAQPEPAIPLSWIEGQIEWLKSLDNAFSTLTAKQILTMMNKWKDEQNE